jgi:hypothetical protein
MWRIPPPDELPREAYMALERVREICDRIFEEECRRFAAEEPSPEVIAAMEEMNKAWESFEAKMAARREFDEWFLRLYREHPELVAGHESDTRVGECWTIPLDDRVRNLIADKFATRPLSGEEREVLCSMQTIYIMRLEPFGRDDKEVWHVSFWSEEGLPEHVREVYGDNPFDAMKRIYADMENLEKEVDDDRGWE